MNIFRKLPTNLFFKFFFSYLLIVVLMVSMSYLIYYRGVSEAEESFVNSCVSNLLRNKLAVEHKFSNINNIINSIVLSTEVKRISTLKKPLQPQDYYRLIEARNICKLYNEAGAVRDIFIYFKNIDYIISTTHISKNIELFFNDYLKYDSMDFKYWKELFTEKYHYKTTLPATIVQNNNIKMSIITYLTSFPLGNVNNSEGVAFVIIDKQTLFDLVDIPGSYNEISMYIINRDNRQIIAESGTYFTLTDNVDVSQFIDNYGVHEVIVNDKSYKLLYCNSDILRWTFMQVIPSYIIKSNVNSLKYYVIAIIPETLVIGIILALFFSYKNYNPIKEIINKISHITKTTLKPQEGYISLNQGVTYLIKEKNDLEEMMSMQKALVKISYLEHLLKGIHNNSIQGNKMIFDDIEKELGCGPYIVAVFKVKKIDQLNIVENYEVNDKTVDICINHLEKQISYPKIFHRTSSSSFAILLSVNAEDMFERYKVKLNDSISFAAKQLISLYNIQMIVGIGNPCENLKDISKSYYQADLAKDIRVFSSGTTMAWYDEIRDEKIVFNYPLELENKLMNYITCSNKEKAIELVDEIYRQNINQENAVKDEVEQFLYELMGTFIKLSNKLYTDNNDKGRILELIKDIGKSDTLDVIRQKIIDLVVNMCDYADFKVKRKEIEKVNDIRKFIEMNYSDAYLNVSVLADKFGMKEKQLSTLFIKYLKENVSSYLERVRIMNSIEMLKYSNRPVKEIAELVGYYNYNTFYKAFRRMNGVGPSEYTKVSK